MGFFKKLPHKATPTELKEVHARLDAQMNGLRVYGMAEIRYKRND